MSECLVDENTEIAETQLLSLLSGKIADINVTSTKKIEVACQLPDGCGGKCTRVFSKNASGQTVRFTVENSNQICALV